MAAGSTIAFVTLWLGLVSGEVTVELTAAAEVATVELRLDGAAVESLGGPPWRAVVDLGEGLLPHHLEAAAFDAGGASLGRIEQWLNLPRPPAEVEVFVEAGEARLSWEAMAASRPIAVRASLDGKPLAPSADLTRLSLPAMTPSPLRPSSIDRGSVHVLRVEVDFETGLTAAREVVLGGGFGDAVETDLTAVAVEAPAPRWGGDGLAIEAAGRPVPLLVVEKDLADLVVVADAEARVGLVALVQAMQEHPGPTIPGGPRASFQVGFVAPLGGSHRLRFLSPLPQRAAGRRFDLDLFAQSAERSPWKAGLLAHLLRDAPAHGDAPRLADAVAVAGLTAVAQSRRRAVLLLVGDGARDASLYTAAAARRFLAALRVPLFVAATSALDPAFRTAWGEVARLETLAAFERLTREISRALDRQRVAWVVGSHLPDALRVVAPAGVRLAGDVDPAPLAALPARREPVAPISSRAAESPGPAPAVAPEPPNLPDLAPAIPAGFASRPFGRFVLHTDIADEATLAALARVATRLPETWAARFGARLDPPDDLGAVVLFARRDDFATFLGRDDPEADASVRGRARASSAVLAAGDEPLEELQALLVHELAHLLARRAFGPPLAPWLEEGLAEELAMSRVDPDGALVAGTLRGRTRIATTGGTAAGRAREVEIRSDGAHGALASLLDARRRGQALGLVDLLALPADRFARLDGRRDRYTAAAFLVRFLLDADAARRAAAFRTFLARAVAGGPTDAPALAAALGEPPPELERRFEGWLRLQGELAR